MISARKLAITSALLEATGIILLVFALVSMITERTALASPVVVPGVSTQKTVYEKKTIHGTPTYISVPSLGIATVVQDGYYDANSGRWTITEDVAFYATISDEANNSSGSTFIYGHNSNAIFGKLRQVQADAKAIVRTDSGYEFTYKLTDFENVAPTDAGKLVYSGKTPRLVLQTCSGFWNETRQLTYFKLESYRKIK